MAKKLNMKNMFKISKQRTLDIGLMAAKGEISYATCFVYILLTDMAFVNEPYKELGMDEVKLFNKEQGYESEYLNNHIRKLKKVKLLTTIYEFELGDGSTFKVNNYTAALKLGIRGMKRSYLIFNNLGEV